VESRRETVVDRVLQGHRLVERRSHHDAEHRTEALGLVEEGTWRDPGLESWGPCDPRAVEVAGLDEPPLPWLQRREGSLQLAVNGLDDGPHLRGGLVRRPRHQGCHRVLKLGQEAARRRDGSDRDHQRCRRALLPGVTECRCHHVLDRQVDVGRRSDDDRVLAARLGKQAQVRPQRQEPLGGVVAAREDDLVDPFVGDERLSQDLGVDLDQPECVARNPRLPQCLGKDSPASRRLRRGLEDDRRSRGQRGQR